MYIYLWIFLTSYMELCFHLGTPRAKLVSVVIVNF